MNEAEATLKLLLEARPEDWSIRFHIVEKMLERMAPDEAAKLVADAPVPPANDNQLRRVAEAGGISALSIIEAYVAANPANAYAHELYASMLESAGDLQRAGQHREVAMALAPKEEPHLEHAIETSLQGPAAGGAATEPDLGAGEGAQQFASGYLPPDLLPKPTAVSAVEVSAGGEVPAEGFAIHWTVIDEPPRRRQAKATAAILAVGIHLLIALIAMLVVIMPPTKDEPEIVAAVIGPTEQKQEMQKKNVVKQTKKTSASSAAAAPLAQLMRANAMAKISLPNVTKTSKGPLGIGDADFGGGGFGSGGLGMGSGASFFGGTSTGRRFLFVLDHSGSMKKNQVELRDAELEKALKSLKGVQYQVLLFAGGAYYATEEWAIEAGAGRSNIATGPGGSYEFKMVGGAGNFDFNGKDDDLPKGEWLASTASNIGKTMEKVKKDGLFYGTDWGLALDIAHRMEPPPDVIFFMADGTGGNTPEPILRVNAKFGRPPINMVAMQTTAGVAQFAEIAKKTKGSFTIVDKDGKPIDGFDYQKNPDRFKGRL